MIILHFQRSLVPTDLVVLSVNPAFHPQYHPPSFLLLKISLLALIISSSKRARTLQEIETEMLAKAEQDRKLEREQQLFAQLHQFEHHEQPQRTRQQELLAQQQLHQQQQRQQRQLLQDEERRRQQPYQQQEQQQQLHRLMQQREQLHQRTPPPRMIPTSQSPRFLEHQRQIILLQQQQELQLQQQQQHLQELQEQLRIEELERRMAAQMTLERNRNGSPFNPRRTPIKYTTAEIQAAHLFQQQQQQQQQLLLQQQATASSSSSNSNSSSSNSSSSNSIVGNARDPQLYLLPSFLLRCRKAYLIIHKISSCNRDSWLTSPRLTSLEKYTGPLRQSRRP
jgi:hypothetical protein